eukprot:1855660-Rhodomonas_salina.2
MDRAWLMQHAAMQTRSNWTRIGRGRRGSGSQRGSQHDFRSTPGVFVDDHQWQPLAPSGPALLRLRVGRTAAAGRGLSLHAHATRSPRPPSGHALPFTAPPLTSHHSQPPAHPSEAAPLSEPESTDPRHLRLDSHTQPAPTQQPSVVLAVARSVCGSIMMCVVIESIMMCV